MTLHRTKKVCESQSRIGTKLKTLRQRKELSINELAKRSGVSAGMISQIEREIANPSVKILERLRIALHVPFSALLESNHVNDSSGPSFLRRGDLRPVFKVGRAPLTKELLSPSGAEGLQFMTISFPPGAGPEEVVRGPGQKAGVVLQGEVHLAVGSESAVLKANDSFQFDSSMPHSIRNDSNRQAKVLWIMAPVSPIHF